MHFCLIHLYLMGDTNELSTISHLAAIIEDTDDAIISITIDGTIITWNKAATRMYGYTAGEVIGRHVSVIIPPDRHEEEEDIIRRVRSGGRIERFETVRYSKNGNLIPVSLTVSPVRDADGNIIGASKIARDISLHKFAEEKAAWLAAIVNSSTDTIISKTLDGIITSWNKAAETMFGYSAEEAVGSHISLIIPQDRLGEEDIIINRIRNGLTVDHFETIRRTKSGREIYISLTVSPIKDSEGKILGASKIARDITEQIQTREKLKEYTTRLEQINSYKDEFIGMASHELKTPITTLNGYLQLLERNITDNGQALFVKKALQQVTRLSTLVADLLDISRIQSGRLTLNFAPFNFCELLREVAENIQQTSQSHVLKIEVPETVPVEADKQRLEQVLINLLTNAIKYSPRSPDILIKAQPAENRNKLIVTVQDFGIGIPRDRQEKIFNRFYRVEEIERSFSGLGLGLYITNEIILRHDGKLWVNSEQGKGSTFGFEIPLHHS